MGRTRLRGIELAGLRVAVEEPSSVPWDTTGGALESFACAPHDPDLYVGVRVGIPTFPRCETVVYESGAHTFEMGQLDDGWVVAVHGRERFERVARFDENFREGEVVIRPGAAAALTAAGSYPLAHPLDEIVVLHRIVRDGGFVMRGSAVIRDGRALVFVGNRNGAETSGTVPGRVGVPAMGEGGLRGDRLVLRLSETGVRVHGVPWRSVDRLPMRSEIDAVHAIERSSAVYAEPLDVDDAASEILSHVYAPVHDAAGAERIGPLVEEVARRIPVLRLGLPAEQRVVPFTWGHRQAALAFAPPFLA